MSTFFTKLAATLTLSTTIIATSAFASTQGGSIDNTATSIQKGSKASAQVASAAVAIPIVVVSGAAISVGTVAEGAVDWAVGGEPLEIADETLVADKDPASVMQEKGGCNCE